MRNQIAFLKPPEDLILDPYTDAGFAALTKPEFLWRPVPRASITGFAASAHAEINAKIEGFVSHTARNKMFDRTIEFNSFSVALQNAWFKKSFVTVNDKCLISGAAGTRLLNRYCWENGEGGADAEQKLVDYFLACQDRAADAVLPTLGRPLPKNTPFAVECRNTFNYYHFITESLCQLCLVEEAGLEGPICLHYPNSDDKIRPFARRFVDALFPEIAGRVVFQRSPVHYPDVVMPYNFMNSFYQMPAAEVGLVDVVAPGNAHWRGRVATRASQGILAMNTVDSSLVKLRTRALRAIEGQDFNHLPKRFWVGRDDDQARPRTMQGEDALFDMLKLFGFEFVAFERLSPLEQIAIMANAEMMISHHGAGFANMLFANPKTYVVELGTLQTAMFRWGDFWRLANAAQCRYVSFFADFNAKDPLQEPSFVKDGIVPVHLAPQGLARVMSFVVSVLGHLPKFSRPDEVQRLGQQLMAVGGHDRARALFAAHQGLERGHVGLCLAMADCHGHFQSHYEQLSALHCAYRLDPTAWPILIRMIWCAKSMQHADTLRAALLALRDGFPERFAAFTKDRPWAYRLVMDDIDCQAS